MRFYTDEDMEKAIQCVLEGTPINDAARRYSIPASTIRARRLKIRQGGAVMDKRRWSGGKKPVLNKFEERELSKEVHRLCEGSMGPTMGKVSAIVADYIKKHNVKCSFGRSGPGGDWLRRFARRNNFYIENDRFIRNFDDESTHETTPGISSHNNTCDSANSTFSRSNTSFQQVASSMLPIVSLTPAEGLDSLCSRSSSSGRTAVALDPGSALTSDDVLRNNIKTVNTSDILFFMSVCSEIQTLSRQEKSDFKQEVLRIVDEKLN